MVLRFDSVDIKTSVLCFSIISTMDSPAFVFHDISKIKLLIFKFCSAVGLVWSRSWLEFLTDPDLYPEMLYS